MAYEKTTWANGDLITPQKLNKLEQGVVDASASGGNIIIANGEFNQNNGTITLDIKPSDIYDGATNKMTKIPIVILQEDEYAYGALNFMVLNLADSNNITMRLNLSVEGQTLEFTANSMNDYFVCDLNNMDDGGGEVT